MTDEPKAPAPPTLQELNEKVSNLEGYITHVHKLLFDVSFKDEVFRRMTIETNPDTYDTLLTYIPKYQQFLDKVKEIAETEKIIDKLNKVKEFNEAGENFTMYVDDTNFGDTVEKSGEISRSTFGVFLNLPHTKVLENKLRVFHDKLEN